MPPPSLSDPWLANRRFGVVIDAGSSGSRLQIYSWRDPRVARVGAAARVLDALPRVDKGTKSGDDWVSKVEPGISSFAHNPTTVASHLAPLLKHARSHIPPSLEPETPIFLLATAGMRLLPTAQQKSIMDAACNYLLFHSHFRIDNSDPMNRCGSSVRIITGEEEGLFGWISVNYLMDGFGGHSHGHRATYGFLDMGGASTQIAFEPKRDQITQGLKPVRLRTLGGEELTHHVFVSTWLGYGTNQARERYVTRVVENWDSQNPSRPNDVIPDPCLPTGLELSEIPAPSLKSDHPQTPRKLVGAGSFSQCLKDTSPLLNKTAPCSHPPCLFGGISVPPIDFSVSHFIGVSEYWYSSENVFGLGGSYDFVQYEKAASEFCHRQWPDIVRNHDRLVSEGVGALDTSTAGRKRNETIPDHDIALFRLRMQCFKAAWIVNVLHEGIGLPRIVDPGGNKGEGEGTKAGVKASEKGLAAVKVTDAHEVSKAKHENNQRPTPLFQSVSTIGDTAISWTLGKMVLEAAKEVPPRSPTAIPITDPMQSIPPVIVQSPTPQLTESTLPSLILFYVVLITMCLALAFRLRRGFWPLISSQRGKQPWQSQEILDSYSMEEGGVFRSIPTPGTPTVTELINGLIRRFTSLIRRPSSPRSTRPYPSRRTYSPPASSQILLPQQPPLHRSNSFNTTVSIPSQRGSGPSGISMTSSFEPSRPGTPVQTSGLRLQPPDGLSRSSSQINLTGTFLRPVATSKAGTPTQTPTSATLPLVSPGGRSPGPSDDS